MSIRKINSKTVGRLSLALILSTILARSINPAEASWPVADAALTAVTKGFQKAMQNSLNNMQKSLSDISNPDSLIAYMAKGFQQNANNTKAQASATASMMDASNTANAITQKYVRDQNIRDQHMLSPSMCHSLYNGQTISSATKKTRTITRAIEDVMDPRGEAKPNTPSYYGRAQGFQAANAVHYSRYCSSEDVNDGLCSKTSTIPDGDQRVKSLFGDSDSYDGQTGVNAANDYATNLVQPFSPTGLRGDQLRSLKGQEAYALRRSYNARMSLARHAITQVIAVQTPSVPVSPAQKQQMINNGIASPPDRASPLQLISMDVDRRMSSADWANQLQGMLPTTVQREIATELAELNYIEMQRLRLDILNTTLRATALAEQTEQGFTAAQPPVPVPVTSP